MSGRALPFTSGAAILGVAIGAGRFAYTPLLVVMRADAGLSVTMAGVLASANLAGYLLGALAGMHPALRANRRGAIVLGTAGVVVLTAAMTLPAGVWPAARFLTGACSGIVFVSVVSLVFDHAALAGDRRGIGILFSGVGIGIAVAGALVPAFAAVGGSRGAWSLLALLSGIVLALALPDLPRAVPPAPAAAAGTQRSSGRPLAWLAVVYAVEGAAYIIPATFLVAMVAESAAIARFGALTWIVVGLVAAPSTIVWNAFARRTSIATALLWALAIQGVALLAPLVLPAPIDAIVVAVALGGTFMGITALATALGRDYRPERAVTVVATLTVWYGVGQIVGPLVATHVALVTGSYRGSFLIAAVALLAATALFAVRLARRG